MFAPVFAVAVSRLDEIDMRNRMLLCAAAIRRYRLKHGKLPATLQEIGLGAQLLADPYSNGEFVYRPIGEDYFLYSVGPDGRDDGGVPTDESQTPAGSGDMGIRRFDGRSSSKTNYRLVPHKNAPMLKPGAPAPPP